MLDFFRRKRPTLEDRPHNLVYSKRKEAFERDSLSAVEQDAVLQLEKPIRKIITKLHHEIEKGAYKLIIGDDASGRIPAFIIGHICKSVYEKNNIPAPHVRFIAGSLRLDVSDRQKKLDIVSAQIVKMQKTVAQNSSGDLGKVLIVTDTISSGASVGVLVDALQRNGWKADVATIGLTSTGAESKEALEQKWGSAIVSGMKNNTPDIYYMRDISGVEKYKENLFATPLKTHDKIRAARAIAQGIADRISNESF